MKPGFENLNFYEGKWLHILNAKININKMNLSRILPGTNYWPCFNVFFYIDILIYRLQTAFIFILFFSS